MKLSIITVNYNNRNGLEKTINSVLSQIWHDYEWIVIDGGSTDGSRELIEKYQEHITFWCSEPDKGIYNAMNKGIAKANGEFVSCMNSGDSYYEKDTLHKVFSVERTGDILYGDWMNVYDDHHELIHFPSPVEIYSFCQRNICQQAMFVRTSILKSKGFDESFHVLADYNRWIEAALSGYGFEYVSVIVCNYDMSGISSINGDLCREEFLRIEKDTLPVTVMLSMQRIKGFEQNKTMRRTKMLLNKGKMAKFITQKSIALLAKLWSCD